MVALNIRKDTVCTFAATHTENLRATPSSKLLKIFKLRIELEFVVIFACYSLTYAAYQLLYYFIYLV
jgi:hypothetical protein